MIRNNGPIQVVGTPAQTLIRFELEKFPDLLIFLMNCSPSLKKENAKKNKKDNNWIIFSIINSISDEKIRRGFTNHFFLFINCPPLAWKKIDPDSWKVWKEIEKTIINYWRKLNKIEKCNFRFYFKKIGKLLHLNFYKKANGEWKEWQALSKASFAYNFHLLEEVCLNVINYFYLCKWGNFQNLTNDKKVEFNIKFDEEMGKKLDILISSTSKKENKEVGLEITEVYSHKNEGKGENQEIILMNKAQKTLWEKIKKSKEKDKIFSETVTNEKEGGLELLLENMKKRIEKKNSKLLTIYKTKCNSLWVILLASFPIYLCKITKEYGPRPLESEEKEIQKDYLYWYLLKKVSEKLEGTKIEFDLLIVTFLSSEYSSNGAFLGKHDPYNKKFHDAMLKKSLFLKYFKKEGCNVILPHFYIPVKGGKVKLEKEIKRKEEEFQKKHKCDVNSIIYWQITSSTLFSYAINFDE